MCIYIYIYTYISSKRARMVKRAGREATNASSPSLDTHQFLIDLDFEKLPLLNPPLRFATQTLVFTRHPLQHFRIIF